MHAENTEKRIIFAWTRIIQEVPMKEKLSPEELKKLNDEEERRVQIILASQQVIFKETGY